jgi:hypothetical protein
MIHIVLALLLQDAVTVTAGDKEVVRYQLKKPADSKLAVESACYFHPLATPSGVVVTDVAPADHKHHRGIFLAWFEMKGKKDADFWGWGQYTPVKDRVIVNKSAKAKGETIEAENEWRAEGETLLQERVVAAVKTEGTIRILDLTYTLTADADIKLPQRAFSGFCARLRKDGKATVESPEGEVKLPAPHHMKPESDWPAQPWYGYQMTLPDGAQVGCAVVDHPKNPKSLWHNAASIRMLNPCIVAPGDFTIKAGEPLVLRYKVVAWDGATPREPLNALAKGWTP